MKKWVYLVWEALDGLLYQDEQCWRFNPILKRLPVSWRPRYGP